MPGTRTETVSKVRPALIVIGGPPAAGKTLVARGVAEAIHQSSNKPALHIEMDDLRHMIVPTVGDGNLRLWLSLVTAILEKSLDLFSVRIVEGLFYYPEEIETVLQTGFESQLVLLEAPLDVCLSRNRRRSAPNEILSDDEVRKLHNVARVGNWCRVDADQSPEDLVHTVLTRCDVR
jgi:predicted kinase